MLPTADSFGIVMGLRDSGSGWEIWSERASEQEVWQCSRSSWCRNRQGLFVATKTCLMQPWQWTALRCAALRRSSPTSPPPEARFAIQHFVPPNNSVFYSVQQTQHRGTPHTKLVWLSRCISLCGGVLARHSSSSWSWGHFLPCNAKLGVGANSWLAAAVSYSLSVTDVPFILRLLTPPPLTPPPRTLVRTKKMQQNILNIIQLVTKRGREWTLLIKTCLAKRTSPMLNQCWRHNAAFCSSAKLDIANAPKKHIKSFFNHDLKSSAI